MKPKHVTLIAVIVAIAGHFSYRPAARGQDVKAAYDRADSFNRRTEGLIVGVAETPNFIEGSSKLWYRKSVKGGHEFAMVNAETRHKSAPFDHARLAASLTTAAGTPYSAHTLPFSEFRFSDDERAIEFSVQPARWTCTLADYRCTKTERPVPEGALRGVNGPVRGPHDPPTTEPKPSPNGRWA